MNHRRRGIAIIFNQKNFDQSLGLTVHNGTDQDRDNINIILQQLDFDVRIYNDLPHKEIENILQELSRDDHSDADCLFLVVLSHGDLGILYASDQSYEADSILNHFNAEKCPSLA